MRKLLLFGSIAFGLIVSDPAICAQPTPTLPDAAQPVPGEIENPIALPDPSMPSPPITQPLPPEMPMQQMPVVIDRSLPPGPTATNPSSGADSAVSGSTTDEMMKPVPSIKSYPLCSRTLQDNCMNPGEAPRTGKKPR